MNFQEWFSNYIERKEPFKGKLFSTTDICFIHKLMGDAYDAGVQAQPEDSVDNFWICPKCGVENEIKPITCGHCGAQLEGSASVRRENGST